MPEAYKEIGGVGGALAQHAEVALEGIGRKRIPLVRELFRNLVTSQGTRAVRERDELLSVFDSKSAPSAPRGCGDVVDALVDARLLTHVQADKYWRQPASARMFTSPCCSPGRGCSRWRAQEADGAQIRVQFRLAAQLWRDRGRSEVSVVRDDV